MNLKFIYNFLEKYSIWFSVLFAVIIFHAKIGLSTLDPTNYEWLLTRHSDWTPDFVAWMYYRDATWSFPIGLFDGYSLPERVSIGLTGGIPLLAIPFKTLSSILPDIFQYFGLWILLCFVLQAIFGYKLLEELGVKDKLTRMLGACLLVLSYSFLDRIGHLNLCAHWLILAGLWSYFSDFSWKKKILIQSLLVWASVWIHPYLIIFSISIASADFFNQFVLDKKYFFKSLISMLIIILVAVGAWTILGNHTMDSESAKAEGFGIFSANLNTFWTPKVDTPLMAALAKAREEQFEGTAYLGLGILAFVFFLPWFWLKNKLKLSWSRSYFVIWTLGIAMMLFAVTHIVTFNHRVIIEFNLPEEVLEKLSILRASGRYIWLIQYLLITSFILLISDLQIRKRWIYLFLALAIIINTVDFYDLIKRNEYIKHYYAPIPNFDQEEWDIIFENSTKIRMYPSHETKYIHSSDHMGFAYTAGKAKKAINTGHLARYDLRKRLQHQAELRDSLLSHAETLEGYTFVTNQGNLPDFVKLYELNQHAVFNIDSYYVFIPIELDIVRNLKNGRKLIQEKVRRQENFGEFISRNQENTMLFAVKDEATNHLYFCKDFQSFFEQGYLPKLKQLNFRESYLAILDGSQEFYEIEGSDFQNSYIQLDTILKFEKDGKEIEKHAEIFSADMDNGNKARIFVEGQDYALNERGLNIVVLGQEGEVVESTRFDTYQSCHHFTEKSELYYDLWRKE